MLGVAIACARQRSHDESVELQAKFRERLLHVALGINYIVRYFVRPGRMVKKRVLADAIAARRDVIRIVLIVAIEPHGHERIGVAGIRNVKVLAVTFLDDHRGNERRWRDLAGQVADLGDRLEIFSLRIAGKWKPGHPYIV